MNITEVAPATKGNVQPSPRNPGELPEFQRPSIQQVQQDDPAVREEKQPKRERRVDVREMQEEVADSLEKLNAAMETFHRAVRFNLHHDSGRMQVNVVNTDNGKVIREIPASAVLNMAKRMQDFIGVLLDEER